MARKKTETASPTLSAPPWRNRIVGHGVVDPRKLLENPNNWRTHPKNQEDGIIAILDEVGWVQQIVVNKRSGLMIDGHLRVRVAIRRGEKKVPVEYVDLTPKEEAIVLSVLDPLTGLAGRNDDSLKKILKAAAGASRPVDALLGQISVDAGFFKEKGDKAKAEVSAPGKIVHSCPRCHFQFSTGK